LNTDSIEEYIATLKSTDRDVLRVSIRALGRLRAAEAIQPLGDLLHTTTDGNTRNIVVKALGKIGDRAAVPILLEHYDDLASDAVNAAFIRLGLFDAVIPNGNDLMASRERRQIAIALRVAAPKLKTLVEQNKLTAEDIRNVMPPMM